MKKSVVLILTVLLCVTVASSAAYIYHMNHREKTIMVATTLPICEVTEKVYSDDYYLNIKLDSWYQEEYKLPSDTILVRTTKSVFEQVTAGKDYIGVCVEIILPDDYLRADVGVLIRENHTACFKIISLTKAGNIRIA
ncbi:MAG: hypothetical protein IJO04_05545 [Oscillospiraceae bacterium]|nr:hypothetical protein [Oscillospiraceae bacterium]